MASEAIKRVVMLTARLEAKPALYPDRAPHPGARTLTLPDGTTAPDLIRAWAGFDERYPWPLSSRRSTQAIANSEGVVTARPMSEILQWVCVDSIKDELSDDPAALEHVQGLARGFAHELPGYGVILDPPEHPDRILWFRAEGEPMLLWYEHEELERREPFDEWLVSLFEK